MIVKDPEEAVRIQTDAMRTDLATLVRIPSVSALGFPNQSIERCAEVVAELFREAGCEQVRLEPIEGGAPAVMVDIPGPDGAPTVLLYAHYDVQPAGKGEHWTTPPFEPRERNGRVFGRGAADDKSGIVMHVATVRAFGGKPPVGVKVLIEGEEEVDSHLEAWVEQHRERVSADVYVIADVGNFRIGVPTITTSLRGLAVCRVTVRTLDQPVHSGMFGGPAPDALMVLIRLLATLHDDEGDVAVEGLRRNEWNGVEYPELDYREVVGLAPQAPLIGTGSIAEMLWARPSINVIGLDAPPVAGAANALVPTAAATVSARIVPGEAPEVARAMLARHLHDHVPWGVQVEVEELQAGEGFAAREDGPGFIAAARALQKVYGRPASLVGQGGSIPLANVLAKAAPGGVGEVILWGAQDEAAHIHGIDESVDIAELHRCVEQQIRFLQLLADTAAAQTNGHEGVRS